MILGSVAFGLDYGVACDERPSNGDIKKIIDFSYDEGINCIDTALEYGDSEAILGLNLKDKRNILVISKIKSDLFVDNLMDSINLSLHNLNIPSLYALLLHDTNLLYDWDDEYSQKINHLKSENKIKHFGVCVYDKEEFDLAIKNKDIEIIQIAFNIFDLRAIEYKYFEKAIKYSKFIFIRSIFLQGLLLMDTSKIPKHLNEAKIYLKIFSNYANKLNMSKLDLAISFISHFSTNSIMIFGSHNLKQSISNIESFNHIKTIKSEIIQNIIQDFSNINPYIYDTRRWE